MSSKLLRGTFVLTLGTYISRILGMIYLIPFGAMVGATGGALFQYGYNQYTLFLNIATMGFPAAVSKFVSKYNSKGDYETSRRMLRAGMSVMLVTGMIAFSILYISAPFLRKHLSAARVTTDLRLTTSFMSSVWSVWHFWSCRL